MKATQILNYTILALLVCSLIPLSFGSSPNYLPEVQIRHKAPVQDGIILFDESHEPGGALGVPNHTLAGGYSTFRDDLIANGYTVQSMGTWNLELLMTASVLVTVDPQIIYSSSERIDIHRFVAQGGGLFIIGDFTDTGYADELAAWFNVTFRSDWLADYDDHGPVSMNIYWQKVSNFGHHPITSGVTSLQTFAGAGLLYYPLGATPLMIMDVDGYSRTFMFGDLSAGMAAMVAFDYQYGAGRVVVTGDSDQFSNEDIDTNAILNYNEGSNALLARNIINWLSHAPTPTKWIIYDESHSPQNDMGIIPNGFHVLFEESHGQGFLIDADNDGIYGHTDDDSGFGDWALMLEANGFTVSNMSTWNPGLLSSANVLVVGNSYFSGSGEDIWSPSEIDDIQNFVINGGGLLFLGEQVTQLWPGYRDIVKTFGVEFFAGAISDSDDFYTPNEFWVKFDDNNLAADHPALNGVKEVPHLWGNALNKTPAGATNILVTDNDGTADWYTTPPGSPSGQNLPCMTSFDYGQGRVIVGGDTHVFVNNSVSYTLPYGNASTFSISIIRWLSEAGYTYGSFYNARETLEGAGYGVISMFDFPSSLTGGIVSPGRLDALIIGGAFTQYSPSERTTIQTYVENDGGSLFLIGDGPSYLGFTSEIAEDFGIRFEYASFLGDSDDYFGDPWFLGTDVIYNVSNFATHPITSGLYEILITGATGINNQPGSAITLVHTDNDATSMWLNGTPELNYPVMSALSPNRGRLVTIGGSWQFTRRISTSALHGDNKTMILDYYHNKELLLNTMAWLTSNRAPIIHVDAPNGNETLNGIITINWTMDDFDNDLLTLDVLITFDDGGTWTTIANGLTNTSIQWNSKSGNNSALCRIRIVADDGFSISEDVSDDVFTIDNPPPPFPWWWIVALAVVIIIVVAIILYMLLRRRGTKTK